MNRDQLVETMARAIDRPAWSAYGMQLATGIAAMNFDVRRRESITNATAALTAIEEAGMRVVPRDDAVNVVASLAAAISIIERTPQARKAAMSDTAFGIMLDDYTKALAAGRAMLAAQPPTAVAQEDSTCAP